MRCEHPKEKLVVVDPPLEPPDSLGSVECRDCGLVADLKRAEIRTLRKEDQEESARFLRKRLDRKGKLSKEV